MTESRRRGKESEKKETNLRAQQLQLSWWQKCMIRLGSILIGMRVFVGIAKIASKPLLGSVAVAIQPSFGEVILIALTSWRIAPSRTCQQESTPAGGKLAHPMRQQQPPGEVDQKLQFRTECALSKCNQFVSSQFLCFETCSDTLHKVTLLCTPKTKIKHGNALFSQ